MAGAAIMAPGQWINAQPMHFLDSVVIQDYRIPGPNAQNNRAIQVMDAEEIRMLPVSSVPELLSFLSGMDIRQRGPGGVQADLSVDGSSFDQVLVLVNGIKVVDPQTGHHMLNLPISLSQLERVEFLRGPAASLYGVHALAGVVNLITRRPESDQAEIQVRGGGGIGQKEEIGKDYYGGGIRLSLSKTTENLGHSLDMAVDQSTGYRHNTAFRIIQGFYQNHWEPKPGQGLVFQAGFQGKDFGANGFYSAPGDRDSWEKTRTLLSSLEWRGGKSGVWTWTPRLSYRLHDDDYIYVRQNPELYRNRHRTQVISSEAHASRPLAGGQLGLGLEYRQEVLRSSNLGDHQRGNLGAFTNIRQHRGPWDLTAGLYQNYHSQYGLQFFPSLDLGYRFPSSLKAFTHFGLGQRHPSYTDLYYEDPGNKGNPGLRPEMAYYLEAGVKHSGPWGRVQAMAFFRHTQDFIDWVREDSLLPWQPLNYHQLQVPGFSIQFHGPSMEGYLGRHRFHHRIQGQYSFLNPRLKDMDSRQSKYVIEALRHQLQLRWDLNFSIPWRLSLSGRYQHRISMNDYWLLDARLGYEKGNWSFSLDLNNLLDTQYREWGSVPLPGRWAILNLGFRLAGKEVRTKPRTFGIQE